MAYAPFDLSGSVALVTGGNSGIGLGMAEALAAAGAAVCIWGTDETKNAAAATTLATHGGRVLALRCDVGDEAQVDAALAHTVGELGRVDACFANAGVAGGGPSFVDMTADEWRRVLRVNLDGAFFTLRAAARHMVARGSGGSLVVTSSLAAIEGAARSEHYAATKGGIISMMRGLAVELARRHPRQRRPSGLDRHPDDVGGARARDAAAEDPAAHSGAPLGRARRLRRHRRLSRERRERVPHRRHVRDRRRLCGVLTRGVRAARVR